MSCISNKNFHLNFVKGSARLEGAYSVSYPVGSSQLAVPAGSSDVADGRLVRRSWTHSVLSVKSGADYSVVCQ